MATTTGEPTPSVVRRAEGSFAKIGWTTVFRWVLGVLFITAAISKVANPTVFLGDLFAYRLPLPEVLLRATVIVLPWLELLCGLLLFANLWSDAVSVIVLGLCLVFLVCTGQAWARGLDISCGCLNLSAFGINAQSPLLSLLESARVAFLRNLLLTACAGYLVRQALDTAEQRAAKNS